MGAQRRLGPADHGRAWGDPASDRRRRREGLRPRGPQPAGPSVSARGPSKRCWRRLRCGILTRLMCSSFTDGAGRGSSVGRPPPSPAPASAPRIIASVARSGNGLLDYHDRMTQTAPRRLGSRRRGPLRRRPGRTARRHGGRGDLRPRVARALPGGTGRAGHGIGRHRHRDTGIGGQLFGRPGGPGIPWAPPGWPRWWSGQPIARAGRWARRWAGPGWASPSNSGGIIEVTPASSPSTR